MKNLDILLIIGLIFLFVISSIKEHFGGIFGKGSDKECPPQIKCKKCPEKVACPVCPDVNAQNDVQSIQNSGVEDIVNDIFKEISENNNPTNNPTIESFANVNDCSLCGENETCEKIKDNDEEKFICKIIDSERKEPLNDEEEKKLKELDKKIKE